MITYATYGDWLNAKVIAAADMPAIGKETAKDYLKRATDYIDGNTRRRFFPYLETRQFTVPTTYVDMRNRAMLWDDLELDKDLLEPLYIQTSAGALYNSGENVPVAGMGILDTTFIATDADGLDANGGDRFAPGSILQIDNERLRVLARNTSTNVVTVERGALQTQQAAHTAGTTISKVAVNTLDAGVDYFLLDLNLYPKYGIRLVWPNSWGGLYGGSSWRWRNPQIFITGFWGYHRSYPGEAWVDTQQTVGGGGLDATLTTLTVTANNGTDSVGETAFEDGYLLRIENELLWVMDVPASPTTTVTVLRGKQGTLAQAHAAGTKIYRFAVHYEVREACFAIAKTIRDADASVGARQGVGEVSTGVEITIPLDTMRTMKRLTRAI